MYVMVHKGWWPQYLPDISKLVSVRVAMKILSNFLQLWEDHGNWCSALKKKAHNIIRDHYKWDPQNHCPVNAEIAKNLLDRGNFLKHGVDVEVSVKTNM